MIVKYPGEIYVYAESPKSPYRQVHVCDTVEQASAWIEQNLEEHPTFEFTIDGTPRAWYEQTGQCGCLVGETCEGCDP